MVAMFLHVHGARVASPTPTCRAGAGGHGHDHRHGHRRAALRAAPPASRRSCPLFVWLPDAMAGPTPVSALIHAATMVTSGVYLLTRMNPVLARRRPTGCATVIAVVGVLTALFAATIAVAQTDIKKVLAYSTVCQLGYMFLAVGSGAYVAAIFHMITHAFFKALMFLGAGSVIHGMHDEQDMRRMGAPAQADADHRHHLHGRLAGHRRRPAVRRLLVEGRDPALRLGEEPGRCGPSASFTALLTAFYMSRQVFLTFFGEARWDRPSRRRPPTWPPSARRDARLRRATCPTASGPEAIHPHESPWTMTLPARRAGRSGARRRRDPAAVHRAARKRLEEWLSPVVELGEHHLTLAAPRRSAGRHRHRSSASSASPSRSSFYLRRRYEDQPGSMPVVLLKGWYYDSSIAAFMGGPGRKAFDAVAWFDRTVVDGAVNGVAALVRRSAAAYLRRTQTGFVRAYAWARSPAAPSSSCS